MTDRYGKTKEQTQELLASLKAAASKNDSPIWRRIASELERPSRKQRVVNFSRINSYAKDGETLLIPGKLLAGGGKLERKVNIIAFNCSSSAARKIAEAGSKLQSIEEAVVKNPKGNKLRIIG